MAEQPTSGGPRRAGDFGHEVGRKETRMLKARRRSIGTVWSGFGLFGLVGWSVAIPTLAGIAVGAWLDEQFPGGRSWTLMFLIIGLGIGCLNAWRWVARENRDIHREPEDGKERVDHE